jgi:hypothetical protein
MKLRLVAECRNWQTNRTQNPAHFTVRVGSSPTSATIAMKILLFIVVLLALLTAIVYYRRHPSNQLQVTPDAREQIEKAKRR